MELNGIPIKKYKAKVLDDNGETRIVTGYVTINKIETYMDLDNRDIKTEYCYAFVSEEININRCAMSCGCDAIYLPTYYERFEIIREAG